MLHRAHRAQRRDEMLAQPPHTLGWRRRQWFLLKRHHHCLVTAPLRSIGAGDRQILCGHLGFASRLTVASCRPASKDAAMPIPIILDCDPGTDDAFALMLALAS